MAEHPVLRPARYCTPVITVGQCAIADSFYVEVKPERLQREREFDVRQGALAHARRLRELYGWRIIDLTPTPAGFS